MSHQTTERLIRRGWNKGGQNITTHMTSSPILSNESPKSLTTMMMDLPPEIHLAIIGHLPYPDALSLKHSSRYFYAIVYTGINLKIEWLISRRQLHLECPQHGSCLLNSDSNFCRGSVRLLMLRRRQHWECDAVEGGRGCLVMGTKSCEWQRARSPRLRLQRWIQTNSAMLVCMLVGLLSVFCVFARASH